MEQTNEFSFILKPSEKGGVGVFATHPIKKGVRLAVWPDDYSSRVLPESEIPKEWIGHCVAIENNMWKCPRNFNRMEVAWYLNHSDSPNATKINKQFYSCKDIKKGEEVLIDYNELGEPENKKEAYYRKNS